MSSVINLDHMRELARHKLPRIAFDFIDGGVDDERGMQRNREAFLQYRLVPRYLRDVGKRDQGVTLFGRHYASPVGISPTGLAGLWRTDADLMQAKAAQEANVPFLLSSASNGSLEEIAAAVPDHVWFQMYCTTNPEINADLVQRAIRARVGVLVISVDVPVNANRERNRRNGFKRPFRMTPGIVLDGLRHPAWMLRYLRTGGVPMMRNWQPYAPPGANAGQVADMYGTLTPAPQVDWSSLAAIRRAWKGALVIKGILHPEDARLAMQAGADGIIVSNHGGRQLDAAPASLAMLPAIHAEVGDRVELILDSGVRRGSDVVIARCLGARACIFGRPSVFGVAAGGQAGVARVLNIMRNEIDMVMAQLGCPRFESLESSSLLPATHATHPRFV